MSTRIPLIAAFAVLTLGAAACTEAETDRAEVEAGQAGETAEEAAARAGETAEDLAARTGEVVEAGAMKAAQAVESGAGKVADKLEAEQAEAAAEGRPGAIDPATDRRVPAD